MDDIFLTPLARAVLNAIQSGFPLSPDPYGDLGADIGASRDEVHAIVQELRQRGIIRRIGGSFVAARLGYHSTLVAVQVDPDRLPAVAEASAAFPEVTHNYERTHAYNLWFTIIAETPERIDAILAEIRDLDGVRVAHSLPALHTYKIRVQFDF